VTVVSGNRVGSSATGSPRSRPWPFPDRFVRSAIRSTSAP
jgi:hypothetical protein